MTTFFSEYSATIAANRWNHQVNNWEFRRFGPPPIQAKTVSSQVKSLVMSCLSAVGYTKGPVARRIKAERDQLDWLYARLEDEESRKQLVAVMAYRTLGFQRVRLPLNTQEYWDKLDELERRFDRRDVIDLDFRGWHLEKIDMMADGYPLQIYARPNGAYAEFVLQQYRCVAEGEIVEAQPGDTVIDAGGCYGETALYFAHKVGPKGRVYSVEFLPASIAVFWRNLSLNPIHASSIVLVENPLWSMSGVTLCIEGKGPGCRVTLNPSDPDADRVTTLTIDDLVRRKGIPKVDFIKMDIEGSELQALCGASDTIRRFRPKLAIAVYHRLSDFWEVARWIDELGLDYRLHLRHFTIHSEETVLFAAQRT